MQAALQAELAAVLPEVVAQLPAAGPPDVRPPLHIYEVPCPVLHKVCQPVEAVDDWLKDFAADMHRTMEMRGGAGLAANQVGLLRRIFVLSADVWPGGATLLNPTLSKPQDYAVAGEGCLSIPSITLGVRRAEKIHLSAWTIDGEEVSRTLTGILARVVQHEVDHLDGVLITNRIWKPGHDTRRLGADIERDLNKHLARLAK